MKDRQTEKRLYYQQNKVVLNANRRLKRQQNKDEVRSKARAYYTTNKDRINKNARDRNLMKENKQKNSHHNKQWRLANRDINKSFRRMQKYGLNEEAFQKLATLQNDRCSICNEI